MRIRNKSIIVKVTIAEHTIALKEASRLGISLSAFVRLLLRQWSNGIRFEKDKSSNEIPKEIPIQEL